ncbi:MAG: NAD(P)/FAD-dependent oxidoreductase [Candidatus Competibacterales bacterium]
MTTETAVCRADVAIVGAGMSGCSLGAALAVRGQRVVVLERESQPGYHSTGRSAAMFIEGYGNACVRALTSAGRHFLTAPPAGFCGGPLLRPRGVLTFAPPGQTEALEAHAEAIAALVPSLQPLTATEARRRLPILRPEAVAAALLEPAAAEIDVHALHHGFLGQLRAHGGQLWVGAAPRVVHRSGAAWRLETPVGTVVASIIVNAAGAWADEVAVLCGAKPLGLVPKRRTVILFEPGGQAGVDPAWPMAVDLAESVYFKPETGAILASPADETPVAAADVQPEELDIALVIDRLEAVTTLEVKRLKARWAGLRTFVPDDTPVLGFDPRVPGLFWCAGQGGYGIQMAPAMARAGAGLLLDGVLPGDITDVGVEAEALLPGRGA